MNLSAEFANTLKQPKHMDTEILFEDDLFSPGDQEDARAPAHQRSTSALTASVKNMALAPAWNTQEEELSRYRCDHGLNGHVKMGTSAPVEIPVGKNDWWARRAAMESTHDVDEEDARASTFVAPHLLVEQSGKEGITFSLNNSLAHKRAILRERTQILRMTGFIENAPGKLQPCKSASKAVPVGIRSTISNSGKKTSALSRQFGVPI